MRENIITGYYGKLPGRGDFLVRHLPRAFVDPWDQWLQQSMASVKQLLNDQWLNIYLTSPIWFFVLSPGVCSKQAFSGLWLPSVDRVGRYFPFTLVMQVPAGENLFCLPEHQAAWYEQAEQAALYALQQEFELNEFHRRLEELDGSKRQAIYRYEKPPPESSRIRIGINPPEQLRASLPIIGEQMTANVFGQYSIWWTRGSERVKPSTLICRHLPPAGNFPAFLDGQWTRWGWSDIDIEETPIPDNRSVIDEI